MNDILAKLFGSAARVKVIRLFLLNPEGILITKEISRRTKIDSGRLRKELSLLSGMRFISKKKGGWNLNSGFSLFLPLKKLVLNTAPFSKTELVKKISRTGRIKLVILSGIFIQEDNSRADMLIAGDDIKKGRLEKVLKEIEAGVGKELNYAVFPTQDFLYRLGIYDKFIRDVLDYPHEKILNKLGI